MHKVHGMVMLRRRRGEKKRLNFSMELKGGPFGACKGLLAQTPGGEGDLSQWRPLGARPWLIVLKGMVYLIVGNILKLYIVYRVIIAEYLDPLLPMYIVEYWLTC